MKLLLDENRSRRMIPALQSRYPGSSQVALLGLERSTDAEWCAFAAAGGFVIISKDDLAFGPWGLSSTPTTMKLSFLTRDIDVFLDTLTSLETPRMMSLSCRFQPAKATCDFL